MIGIYCRVSTQTQAEEGYSLETQEELCKKRAIQLGYTISDIKVYREEGRSGEDIDRPKMNELREDISNGLITKVIITDPDRLTRDLTDKLIVCKEWDRYGAEIIFIDTEYQNTPEGQMFFNMRSVFAQYELSQIRKRTIRGRLRAVEKDNKIMPMRVPPYGYDYEKGSLMINEHEAQFVKKIYNWYLSGSSLREIGERLFKEGAVPKRAESKNFGATSIRRILTSEIYIGRYVYNKRATKKVWGEKTESGKQKKTYHIRDESEWLTVIVPSIIDEETYNLAQIQKEKNRKKRGNVKVNYLFKGLIRCNHCGRIWECTTFNGRLDKTTGIKKQYAVYRCPNVNPKRYGDGIEKCNSLSIRVELLDEYIMKLIKDTMTDRKIFGRVILNHLNIQDETFDAQIEELEKQCKRKEDERERVKRMYVVAQVITEQEMLNDMKLINEQITTINDEINLLHKKKMNRDSRNLSDETVDLLIANIEKMLVGDEMSFDIKRELIELLVEEITIDAKCEQVGISVKGLLDHIASWSHRQKI
ncbi:recombinase family protein [Peribacillus saganii]|uniref:Recombinase family protein n=1 Tax=Peribacillus saganii TaxID=2303992 RepID=A0A372LU96_9BACI|nr:recombinase family protein [Peribacillus saganii]RFU71646.1 recombinase family protein [Peribacillus saganii]